MKKIYFFILIFITQITAFAQININETFDGSTTPTGWTYAGFSRTTTSPCLGTASLRRNIYSSFPSGTVTTPTWVSNGTDVMVSFSYKLINFSGGTATPNTPDWGKYICELSIDGGTTYTIQVDSLHPGNHISSATCASRGSFTIAGASVPTASNTKVRFRAQLGTSTTPDYNIYLDNVVISQVANSAPPCNSSTPITPADAATNVLFTPTLSWPSNSGATSYDIYFGTSATPPLVTNITATSYTTTTLMGNTTYYWQVIPKNNIGAATGCPVFSFTTACTGFVPVARPATTITGSTAQINWSKATPAPAGGYDYYYSTSSTAPVIATMPTGNTADTFAILSSLSPGTTYYFWARFRCDASNIGSWTSTAGTFGTLVANDLCIDAIDITSKLGANASDTVGKVTLVNRGSEGILPRPGCTGSGATGQSRDVWYKFTASSSTDSTIIYTGTNDWIAELYGACGGGPVLACSDDDNSLGPVLKLCGLTDGQTYYLRLMPYSSSTTTVMWIYKGGTCPPPPANDNCSGAIAIDCATPVAGTTLNSSASTTPNSSCGSLFATQSDVWYKFTSGATDFYKYLKIKNIETDKKVHAAIYYGSSCSNLVYFGCSSNQVTDSLIASFPVVANSDYYIRVYSVDAEEQGSFDISLCDSSAVVIVDTVAKNVCSTDIFNDISAANQNNTKWVRFVSSARGLVAEINANGNDLGETTIGYFKSNDATRTEPTSNIIYLSRNIGITVTNQPTSPVSVRLYFTDAEKAALDAAVPAANDRSDIVVTKFAGGCQSAYPLYANAGTFLTQTANAGFNSNGHYIEVSVSSFSNFFLHKGTTPLAISLQSFTATKQNNNALVSWKMSATSDVKSFEIQKSADNKNFQNIGNVNAITGNTNYSFTDVNLNNGANYYKLKMIDQNGKITFSKVAVVFNSAKGFEIVSLIPTITANKTTVTIASAKATQATLIVTDAIGRVMMNKKIGLQAGNNDIIMDASKFTQGIYQIHAISADGKSNVMRLIKE